MQGRSGIRSTAFYFLCIVAFACRFPIRCKIGRGPRKASSWETDVLSRTCRERASQGLLVLMPLRPRWQGVSKRALLPWAAGFVSWSFPAKIAVGGAPTRPSSPPSLQSALRPAVQCVAFSWSLRSVIDNVSGRWGVVGSSVVGKHGGQGGNLFRAEGGLHRMPHTAVHPPTPLLLLSSGIRIPQHASRTKILQYLQ